MQKIAYISTVAADFLKMLFTIGGIILVVGFLVGPDDGEVVRARD